VAEQGRRIRMKVVSEAARGWAQALAQEVESWPDVKLKNAFGMTMLYRKGIVFGALPRTRALFEDDAILLKFNRETPALLTRLGAEPHFAAGTMEQRHANKKKGGEGRRWRIFLLRSEGDLHSAIEWLAEAHHLATQGRQKRQGPKSKN
jgi:hypothetical protein